MRHLRPIVVAVLVVFVLVALPAVAFAADPGVMHSVAPRYAFDAWGDILVYGQGLDLYAERLSDGTRTDLGPTDNARGEIQGDWITWAKRTRTGQTIRLRNIVTGETRDLGPGTNPCVWFDRVVYEGAQSFFGDIRSYTISTRETTTVAGGPGHQTSPALYDRYLAYRDDDGGVAIRLKDLRSGSVSVVATGSAFWPQVGAGGWVAWCSGLGGDGSPSVNVLHARKMPNGESVVIDGSTSGDSGISAENVRLDGARLSWTRAKYKLGGAMSDTQIRMGSTVRVRDLATTGAREFGVVVGPDAQGVTSNVGLPIVAGDFVAWSQSGPLGSSLTLPFTFRTASFVNNLYLSATSTAPKAGSRVVLTARVLRKDGTPVTNANIAIERWTGAQWTPVAKGLTATTGRFLWPVYPTTKTTYRLRLVGSGAQPSNFSEKLTVWPK